MLPDVNVLVAASRLDHEQHVVADRWLAGARGERRAGLVILPVVAAGFLRIVRLPNVFAVPTPHADAVSFLSELLATPRATMPELGAEWPVFVRLYEQHAPAARAVTDLWIAAAVLHLGEHLVTLDRGFRRLLPPPQLTVLDPASA